MKTVKSPRRRIALVAAGTVAFVLGVMGVSPALTAIQAPAWLQHAWDAGTFITGLTLGAIAYYAGVSWMDLQERRETRERETKNAARRITIVIESLRKMKNRLEILLDVWDDKQTTWAANWVRAHLHDGGDELRQIRESLRDCESLTTRTGAESVDLLVELYSARRSVNQALFSVRSAIHQVSASGSDSVDPETLKVWLEGALASTEKAREYASNASAHLYGNHYPFEFRAEMVTKLSERMEAEPPIPDSWDEGSNASG